LPERESDNLPPSSAEVKNDLTTPLLQPHAIMAYTGTNLPLQRTGCRKNIETKN